ncbi:hypothetical protein [Snodgrassella alvi]|uniref:hypothetical protein n=1 Tax=Snodgrassella alvi TaxID=1196083 RepID=UPI000C1DDA9B|nr:hypothetical protein [Snodgrassella alvi]
MPFMLYTDAQMTMEANSPYQLDFNGAGKNEFKLFFGSPYSNEVLKPKSDPQIMLVPASRLKKWEPNRVYSFGNIIEPIVSNGCMYQCLDNAQTGSSEPAWRAERGSKCSSGSTTFINLGAKFQPADVQLALTYAGLDTANAGAALELGTQLQGGKAIPVYIRVTNTSNSVRSDRSDPCISIRLNATITETTA